MKIIRTRQRPLLVIVDAAFTVLAWIGLLYLLVRGLWPLIDTHDGPRIEVGVLEALGTLQTYLWVALLNAAVLILWARYQQRKSKGFARRRLPSPALDDQRLSESFKLSAANFARMRQSGTMTVHNDEEGGISLVTTGFLRLSPERQPHPPLLADSVER
ncbi:poly-beta-1,6-N-acetyl-D-glucosamine biosynthesis protein PgaD [Pseudomonas chlororaphis]|uniref:poly-beta-1,6-N-acetyl-D-glucosamine biosynthesis protein PgaD n=1 Tax=Pseudomonas chlororaphis TaxID=587753 RepID=UPI00240866E9|nr:poly-beta-1,6-N-acetyl-D-glucosamine biosynthesis protein PgaD [Pseudomonas chlororaphis]